MNACNYPLFVTAACNNYPPTTTPVAANQQVSVCAQPVITSGRVWASTDCAVQDSCVAAQPPVSLFEMTFNPDGSQFMDVSYVDGISDPIGVRVKNCQPGQDQTVTFEQQAVDNLRQMFPQMAETDNASGVCKTRKARVDKVHKKNGVRVCLGSSMVVLPTERVHEWQTKVKSVCGYYNALNVCCQNEFSGGPQFCGPGKSGWTPDQTQAYDAFTAISGNSYAFAFDDKRATVQCNGATAVNIGFCMNPLLFFKKTQIKSLCGTYNSDDVCCRAAYGTPDTCQPTNWAPEKQAIYNALRAANPDGYTYAYDDKTAIKKCSSSSAAIVGFCTNV
ncbi:hypothetical protein niasHS_011592 [Heterodera schachtii]|uniref:Uncharacterized protein n=1 Tax=Heterodera schachtii TaxID=97005 RepID=A0ABD2IBV2_HETSC